MKLLFLAVPMLVSAAHHGTVTSNGLPVPGASVTAIQGKLQAATITDLNGAYSLPEVTAGTWLFQIEMQGFTPIRQDLSVADNQPGAWSLQMLPLTEMKAARIKPASTPTPQPNPAAGSARNTEVPPPPPPVDTELSQRAADGFLVNGTANNGASSPFSLSNAFGNARRNGRALYNGGIGMILGNSNLDAKPFSVTGQDTPRPGYNNLQGLLWFGGPIRIPRLLRNGPNLTMNYQWTRSRQVTTQSGIVPTPAERAGSFASPVLDPLSGLPFPGNTIPRERLSPQAQALLQLYPLPNFSGARYNYQAPLVQATHQDSLQTRLTQRLPKRNSLAGSLAIESTRGDTPNLLGFLDTTRSLGINSTLRWTYAFNSRQYLTTGIQFSRLSSSTTPYFANRQDVAGMAGIGGVNHDPMNWGPPALNFSGGISALSDAQFSQSRDQTTRLTTDFGWNHGRHNITIGGSFRRQQFNLLSQEDPRGTFMFTGASTGSDFASFLLGLPDTSSIAYGNADKYFRAPAADLYINDDWRISPGFTLNVGIRWEYGAPITEKYGRLVNLDIAPGFTAATPVVERGSSDSLIRPDLNNFAPRLGFAWRPLPASSLVIRGGYGIYYDTSVYQNLAVRMSQQSPLSTSLRVSSSPDNLLTLADGFRASSAIALNTFAVDPDFRTGYSQNWQLSIQRDLPASLVVIATYRGIKGTRSQQQFLPNTFPDYALEPSGFTYLASNGNSILHAGNIEVRRRLRAGLTATLQYTYSKSIDNAALGGKNQTAAVIAQNWLDLSAERARSNFDQRHLLSAQAQYTTGMGFRGALLSGWRARAFREWTVTTQITAGSGLPLTPIYLTVVRGTGVTGSIRPDYTGASLFAGSTLNPQAFAPPAPGTWGNAGRNSITGPSQFTLNASLGRTFRVGDRLNLDVRVDAANALNHPVFPGWNTTVTSTQFGLPSTANPMRTIQTTARLRF